MNDKIAGAIPMIILYFIGLFIIIASLNNILNTPQNTLSFYINSVFSACGVFISFGASYVCGYTNKDCAVGR